MGGRRGWAAGLLVAIAVSGCQDPAAPVPDAPSPTERPSPEPQVATFETRLNLLEVSGSTCRGLEGPWRVRLSTPSPIEGSGVARFRVPGRLRWSFPAQHPGHGLVTYAGDVRVRLGGAEDAPVLFFVGDQTAVGVTSRVFGRARLDVGGACPR